MNKKKFEKKLESIKKSGSFSLYFIDSLFKEEKKSFFNNEKIENLIENNFKTLMKYVGRGNVDSFIDTLYSYDSMKPFLKKEETIKYILDNVKHDDFRLIINDSSIKEKSVEFVHENFDYVLKNYSMKKIVNIYESIQLNEKEIEKMDKYFNDKKEEFLSEILTKTLSFRGNVNDEKMDSLLNVVKNVVDKVLEKENCKITDVKILLSGNFSNVLRIGDTVVKVGIPRKTHKIPNDKRILQPRLRRDLSEEYGIEAAIEVSDRVDTNISLSEKELYEIYKDMRDRGIVCGDFKYDNIGKLIKPNIPCNKESEGMMGNVSETLDSGEYVLIDTDFVYKEDDPKIDLTSALSRKFESMYKNQNIKK